MTARVIETNVTLGGPNSYGHKQIRQIEGFFEWIEGEPALVLVPLYRLNVTPYAICESSLPEYFGGAKELLAKAIQIAQVLGFDPTDRGAIANVADCLNVWLPDLLLMPPKPNFLKRVVDEALVTVNDKEIHAQRLQ